VRGQTTGIKSTKRHLASGGKGRKSWDGSAGRWKGEGSTEEEAGPQNVTWRRMKGQGRGRVCSASPGGLGAVKPGWSGSLLSGQWGP
jgi:hypothetical protein